MIALEICASANDLDRPSELLCKFFFPQLEKEEIKRKLIQGLGVGFMEVGLAEINSASRTFSARVSEQLVIIGSAEVRAYSSTKLKEQLVIACDNESIWLSKMGRELSGLDCTQLAIELAYFCVEPEYQGLGIGKELFYRSILSTLGEVQNLRCGLFTLAKGVYSGSGKGQLIRDYLLEIEKDFNGTDAKGMVIVKGEKTPLSELEMRFGVVRSNFRPRGESVATQILAQRWGWKMLGLSKNLSPVWGTTVFLSN